MMDESHEENTHSDAFDALVQSFKTDESFIKGIQAIEEDETHSLNYHSDRFSMSYAIKPTSSPDGRLHFFSATDLDTELSVVLGIIEHKYGKYETRDLSNMQFSFYVLCHLEDVERVESMTDNEFFDLEHFEDIDTEEDQAEREEQLEAWLNFAIQEWCETNCRQPYVFWVSMMNVLLNYEMVEEDEEF